MDWKQRRKELGFTQLKVAKACNVSLMTYQLWERGAMNPNEKNFKKLIEVLSLKERVK
jgi:transcriptional regulator with XRE-family HTH domain